MPKCVKGKQGVNKKSVKWVSVQTNCSEQGQAETKHFRHRNRVWSQVTMAMTMKTDMLFAQQLSVFLCDTSQAGHRVPVQALAALFSVCWLCHSFCWELHSLCDKITSIWPPNAILSTGFQKMFLLLTDRQSVTVILLLLNVQHSAKIKQACLIESDYTLC
jgi:hypothetical protein